MSNWRADPVACAIRLKKQEGGCIILATRGEVVSRSTRVMRTVTEEPRGKKNVQVTTWAAGHVQVYREGGDQRKDAAGANLFLRYNFTPTQATVVGPLLSVEATLMSDVLRAAAVNSGGAACGGQTLLELIWEELMVVMERLMNGAEADDGRDPGRAEGLALALAIMQNPYRPSIDSVREQALAKWEEENG